MKKFITIILMSFTMIAFAQHNKEVKERKMKFTAEQQAILHTKQMALALDLNDAQQKQLLSLNQKQALQKEKMMKQHQIMKENNTKPSQDEIFDMKNKMLDTKIAHQQEVKKILNDKQFEEWRKSSKKRYGAMKTKMQKKHMHHEKMKRK